MPTFQTERALAKTEKLTIGLNEADTCRKYVLPKLAAWDKYPHSINGNYYIDAGRILTTGLTRRRQRKYADYLLCYTRNFPLAIVEAKRKHKSPQDGRQQAKDYAELLGLKFAYSTPAAMPHLNARNGTTMSDQELCYLSATEAIALFQKRQLSPVELVQALITRTEQVNPLINAYTYTFYERALSAAKQAEAKYNQTDGNPRPLEGIPLAIKDLHAIKGEITTYGSKLLADNRDSHTIPTVERLLQAGAILRFPHYHP